MSMERKRYTEPQIVFVLQQAEAGTPVAELCRKMGVAEATFYRWKKRYGGLGVSEIRRLCQLEDENGWLKQLVGDDRGGKLRAERGNGPYTGRFAYRRVHVKGLEGPVRTPRPLWTSFARTAGLLV